MKVKLTIYITIVLIIGILSSLALSYSPGSDSPSITTTYVIGAEEDSDESFITRILGINEERPSPYDWVSEQNIHVYEDKIVIEIENAEWARFTDTNSMDPVIDYGANAIEIRPTTTSQIHVGDIVSYQSKYSSGTIIHRVIETGFDGEGWYAIMKGDNNPRADPGKVRFSQIRRLVIAIIY